MGIDMDEYGFSETSAALLSPEEMGAVLDELLSHFKLKVYRRKMTDMSRAEFRIEEDIPERIIP